MADAAPMSPAPADPPLPGRRGAVRLFGRLALVGAIAFGGAKLLSLYREITSLREDWKEVDRSRIVGYVAIDPAISTARPPGSWLQREGDSTLVWAGWQPDIGHDWFRFPSGELDPTHLRRGGLLGRDAIRAIDYPLVEDSSGIRWQRVWGGTPVIGLEFGRQHIAYPLLVLNKVQVVNDTIGGKPVLVVCSPYAREQEWVACYEPTLNGQRVTLGLSGYAYDDYPLLYDRGTDSLWAATERHVIALAGKHKGAILKLIRQLEPMTWDSWQTAHPGSPLLIGADRSRPKPAL